MCFKMTYKRVTLSEDSAKVVFVQISRIFGAISGRFGGPFSRISLEFSGDVREVLGIFGRTIGIALNTLRISPEYSGDIARYLGHPLWPNVPIV